MSWDTSIARKGPAQPALPCVRCSQTSDPGRDNERFQDDSTGVVADSLVEQLQDRYVGGRACDPIQITQTEHHADAEEPSCHKSDPHRPHDGDWYHFLWSRNFLCQMCGAVQTCEGPVGVDETDDKGDTVLGPSRGVDKSSKNEFGGFMGWGLGWDGDEDYGEGDEGGIESAGCEGGKDAAIAIKEEG